MSTFAYLDQLLASIASRVGGDPKQSYTAKLLSKGTPKITKKLGEEAVETVIAAMENDKLHTVSESADLLFHLLVLWQHMGIQPEEVMDALRAREVVSGIDEKASRTED